MLTRLAQLYESIGTRDLVQILILALVVFALLRTPAIAARTGFPPDQFPVAAAAEVEKLAPTARILAPDKFGGYLIYRFQGTRKVFFDGRSEKIQLTDNHA